MKKKLHYKWIVTALCFMMVLTTLGFCSGNRSLFLSAITEALDLPRTAFAFSDSIRYIFTAFVNIFFGNLVRKFGTKKLIGAGFLSLIGFAALYAIADNVFTFYLGSAFLGIGLSWTTTTMVGWIIGRWHKENKGTIMGAVLAANGIGGAIATQIISPIIYQPDRPFGYRNAFWLIVVILFCMGLLIMIFYRDAPQDESNQIPHANKKNRGQSWEGLDFELIKKQPYFYSFLICILLTGMILQGAWGVCAAHMRDSGLDSSYIATIISISSLGLTGSKFLTGVLYDKLGLRCTIALCDLSAVFALIALAMIGHTGTGSIAAAGFGIIICLALPLETIMLPIFAGDLFGERSYDKALGLLVSVNTTGYAVGAPLTNLFFDQFGTYTPLFFIYAGLMLVITCVSQFNVTAVHNLRKATTMTT